MLPPTHSVHIVLLDFITLITFEWKHKCCSSSLCRFTHYPDQYLLSVRTKFASLHPTCRQLQCVFFFFFFAFVIPFVRYNIKRNKLSSKCLVSAVSLIWQFVSTSEVHIKTGVENNIKLIIMLIICYIFIYVLLKC
jgi:hypothetical protein